jgi:signal transduction histidine kinase
MIILLQVCFSFVVSYKWLDKSIIQTLQAIADIRRLLFNLRPPALDELGFVGVQ